MAHDVFISHSTKDKQVADQMCAALEAEAIKCWIAPRDILPGKIWAEAIIDGIDNCRVMIAVISSNANASGQIKREIERADANGVTLVPFFIEKIAPSKYLEYYIGNTHWFDASAPPLDEHLHKLVEAVKTLLGNPNTAPQDVSPEDNKVESVEHLPPAPVPIPSEPMLPVPTGSATWDVLPKNYEDGTPAPHPTSPLLWVMVGVAALVLAGVAIFALSKLGSSKPDNQNNQTVKSSPTSTPDPTQGMNGGQLAAFKEREGFQSLIDGDYDRAIKAFDAANKAFPNYRSVFEIAKRLRERRADLDDPNKRPEVFRSIIKDFQQIPRDFLPQLTEKANARTSVPAQNNQPQPSATPIRPTRQPDMTRPIVRDHRLRPSND